MKKVIPILLLLILSNNVIGQSLGHERVERLKKSVVRASMSNTNGVGGCISIDYFTDFINK